MNYTIYKTSNGRVTKTVFCREYDASLQIDGLTEAYVEGHFPDNYYYIANGVAVKIPDSPNSKMTFNYDIKQWVDPRTVAQVQLSQWSTIKLARQAAIEAPIVTAFGTFDADSEAQKSITDAVLMLQTLYALGTPSTIDFTLADNSTVTLTTEQMVTVGLMLGQQTQAAHAHSRIKRAATEAATPIPEVEAITWSTP